jgi:glycosyltransferase involved in cell wall biosynthesis
MRSRSVRGVAAHRRDLNPTAEGLEVSLDRPLPASLPVGAATAIFCVGTCFHRHRPVADLTILVNGVRRQPTAQRMPRRDRFQELHPNLPPEEARSVDRDPDSVRDPELRSYRSGFWATIPIDPRDRPGELKLAVEARLSGGTIAAASVGTIEVVERPDSSLYENPPTAAGEPLIAICMATFNPNMELFRAQVESIQAQTYGNWVCVISDDCSEAELFDEIAGVVERDERFLLSRADRHLSFFRNFERALELAPAEADFLALCDQDDRWYPEKLEALLEGIGPAELAYSDLRRVDVNGGVRAETLWQGRRNNHTNLASLLISNTIVGASCLIRRRAVEHALPFPSGPGWDFHDHWLVLVALSTGDIAYIDCPLYDQVQHPGAVLGHVGADEGTKPPGKRPSLRARIGHRRGFLSRWRSAYFSMYLQRDFHARVLLERCGPELNRRKRRALGLIVSAARSPLALAWLAGRPARALVGKNETLRLETVLAKGILWRDLIALLTMGRQRPGRSSEDASMPSPVPQKLVPRQRRWLARR